MDWRWDAEIRAGAKLCEVLGEKLMLIKFFTNKIF